VDLCERTATDIVHNDPSSSALDRQKVFAQSDRQLIQVPGSMAQLADAGCVGLMVCEAVADTVLICVFGVRSDMK
jgi:hypothetical protein